MHTPAHIASGRKLRFPLPAEAARRLDDDRMIEGVYERIKRQLLSRPLKPGQLLQIRSLAEDFGVSATPVREALTRLAAERLIVAAPRRGFFARTPSDEDIRGLYCVNQALLDCAVVRSAERAGGSVSDPLQPCAIGAGTAEHLAASTASLFLRIAGTSECTELVDIVRNINDRLHRVRLIECDLLEDAANELRRLSAFLDAGDGTRLRAALRTYHERRGQRASSICKELLLRSFLPCQQ